MVKTSDIEKIYELAKLGLTVEQIVAVMEMIKENSLPKPVRIPPYMGNLDEDDFMAEIINDLEPARQCNVENMVFRFLANLLEDTENESGLNAYRSIGNGINEVVYDIDLLYPVADENYIIAGNKTQLYNAFKEFAKENYNSSSVMNSVAFGSELEKLGFKMTKHKNSKSDSRYYNQKLFTVNRAKLIETLEPMLSKPIDRELLAVHGGSDQ